MESNHYGSGDSCSASNDRQYRHIQIKRKNISPEPADNKKL